MVVAGSCPRCCSCFRSCMVSSGRCVWKSFRVEPTEWRTYSPKWRARTCWACSPTGAEIYFRLFMTSRDCRRDIYFQRWEHAASITAPREAPARAPVRRRHPLRHACCDVTGAGFVGAVSRRGVRSSDVDLRQVQVILCPKLMENIHCFYKSCQTNFCCWSTVPDIRKFLRRIWILKLYFSKFYSRWFLCVFQN